MATRNSTEASSAKQSDIYRKILAVQQAIDSVPKRGFNAFHKYSYATEADILTVKETLNNHGLVVLPTTLREETGFKPDGKSWAAVTLLFRLVDVESGDSVESQFSGYAEDAVDKAIYKATTGANKYFYLKFFGIATEDDPEREDHVPSSGGRGAVPKANPAVSAPALSRGSSGVKTDANKPERRTDVVDPGKRNQALTTANKILALQKQHALSNEAVLRFGEIPSIRELAEDGQTEQLAAAYQKLSRHVQLQTSH